MSIFAIFRTVAAVMPLVDALVQQVESAMPSGKGADKLAQVKAFLDSAWSTVAGIEVTLEQVWPVISSLITVLVGIYSASGKFRHASVKAA